MSSVLLHVLILWGLIAVALAILWTASRLGVEFRPLPYAGVFGFVGAAFGVVLGMSTFFASQHYANLREAAESEATLLGNVAAMTGAFPPREGTAVRRQIYCYATDVIDREWPDMAEHGDGALVVENRERAVYLTLLSVGRSVPQPESWYTNAVRGALDAAQDRQQRLLLSQPQIPGVMWFLIYVGAGLIILFAFFFHLESRRQLVGMFAAVIVMLTAIIGVLAGLDAPTEEPFALQPEAMRVEQRLLESSIQANPSDPAHFCQGVHTPTIKTAIG